PQRRQDTTVGSQEREDNDRRARDRPECQALLPRPNHDCYEWHQYRDRQQLDRDGGCKCGPGQDRRGVACPPTFPRRSEHERERDESERERWEIARDARWL